MSSRVCVPASIQEKLSILDIEVLTTSVLIQQPFMITKERVINVEVLGTIVLRMLRTISTVVNIACLKGRCSGILGLGEALMLKRHSDRRTMVFKCIYIVYM